MMEGNMEVNESRPVAINISGVKKMYKLGQIGGGTLQADLESWWARVRGKEDPNTKIGEGERIRGKTFMALNGIDLTIYQGEAVGIIGRNGAGKSTLLKLLSKVTAPTEGEIDIYGRIASMLEVGTGFNGEMTGRENVYMNGAILGMTRAEIDAKMEQIIEFSEVREFIDTPVKRYSSGMFVKLAFSVAAHLDSEIMIMDEVLAVGDMAFQKKCLDKMREAAKQDGRTVLYVSHNMNTIRTLCDRCIVLDKGKVVFEGEVNSAIELYLNRNKNDQIKIDFTKRELAQWLTRPKIHLLEFEFLNKQNNIFSSEEIMRIYLKWAVLTDIKDVSVRFEVFNGFEEPVSMYCLFDVASCESNQNYEFVVDLDIRRLAESDYQLKICFFENDKFGNNVDIGFGRDIYFKKILESGKFPLIWQTQKWGYVIQSAPKLVSFSKIEQ